MSTYKKYSTILEETAGVVNDLHYGKYGQLKLAEDLIYSITGNKKII